MYNDIIDIIDIINVIDDLNRQYIDKKMEYTRHYIFLQKLEGENVTEKDNRLLPYKLSIEKTQHQIINLFECLIDSLKLNVNAAAIENKLRRMNNEKFCFSYEMCKAIDNKLKI
jgi:hypothetical protein